jgi:acetoin utilization deacetylase AcuC-like enzyme
MVTGLAWDERCMWHDTGLYFGPQEGNPWIEPIESPENAQGKRRIKNLLDASGLTADLSKIEIEPASETDILMVHTPEYLAGSISILLRSAVKPDASSKFLILRFPCAFSGLSIGSIHGLPS